MKPTQTELRQVLLTIECQHRQFTANISSPAAKYLRAEWRSWAALLKREYPQALLPPDPTGWMQ